MPPGIGVFVLKRTAAAFTALFGSIQDEPEQLGNPAVLFRIRKIPANQIFAIGIQESRNGRVHVENLSVPAEFQKTVGSAFPEKASFSCVDLCGYELSR